MNTEFDYIILNTLKNTKDNIRIKYRFDGSIDYLEKTFIPMKTDREIHTLDELHNKYNVSIKKLKEIEFVFWELKRVYPKIYNQYLIAKNYQK